MSTELTTTANISEWIFISTFLYVSDYSDVEMLGRVELLADSRWTLTDARKHSATLIASPRLADRVVRCLFGSSRELRTRAADVLRRATEKQPRIVERYTDEFIGLLGEIPVAESRTRWHLTLVAARSAQSAAQCSRLASILLRMMDESGNVLRCCALEGLSGLALKQPTLRRDVEVVLHSALRLGTAAMQCRARHGLARLELHCGATKEATQR